MTNQPPPDGPGPDLQFERAQYEGSNQATAAPPAAATCVACQRPISDEYFTVNQSVMCPDCLRQLHVSMTGGSGTRRLLAATAWGVGAAFLGALLWFAVRKTTGYEVGLIAIVVGLMVGAAVRRGSQGRGGLVYQLLAIFLTYSGIVSNYIPDVFMALRESFKDDPTMVSAATQPASEQAGAATDARPATSPAVVGARSDGHDTGDAAAEEKPGPLRLAVLLVLFVLLLFALAFIAPILAGFENIIGLLIIGFALWEAWKMNKRPQFDPAGPFRIGAGAGGTPGMVAAAPPPPPPPPGMPSR